MNETIDPARITWLGNTGKRNADNFAYRALAFDLLRIAKKRGVVRTLSFPGPEWLWEQSIDAEFSPLVKFEFTGIERDPKVLKRLKKKASGFSRRFKMHDAPTSFIDFVVGRKRAAKKPFDLVYLDWMGTWSREKKDDIDVLFLDEVLAKDGLLILTVSLCRGQPATMKELEEMEFDMPFSFHDERGRDEYVKNPKVRGIPAWVSTVAADYGYNLKCFMANVYYSSTGVGEGACRPQLQLLFAGEKNPAKNDNHRHPPTKTHYENR